MIKEFTIDDFAGGVNNSTSSRDYVHLSHFWERADGSVITTTRWIGPGQWTFDRKTMTFSPEPYPFTDKDFLFTNWLPFVDDFGNKLYSTGSFMPPYNYTLVRADGTRRELGKQLGIYPVTKFYEPDNPVFLRTDLSKTIYSVAGSGALVRNTLPTPRVRNVIPEFGYLRPTLLSADTILVSSFRHGVYYLHESEQGGALYYTHLWYDSRKGVMREGKNVELGGDGKIWANDEYTLFGVDPRTKTGTEISLPGLVGNDWALIDGSQALLALKDGSLVLASLASYETEYANRPEISAESEIMMVHYGGDGQIWLGTTQGLYKGVLKDGRITWSGMLIDLGTDFTVYDIYEESRVSWWLSTNKGLIHFKPRNLTMTKRYTVSDGLAGNEVRSVVFAKGFYWIGTRTGMSRFNPLSEQFRTFSYEAGFTSLKFTPGAVYLPDLNFVGMGTDKGFNYFQPEDLFDDLAPTLSVSSIKYFSQEKDTVAFEVGGAHLQREISLPAKNRALELNFFINDFSEPDYSEYAYRFVSDNPEWISLKNVSRLSFNALPHGTSVLEIRGRTRFSAWSEPHRIELTVARFFYDTWWFRLGGVMLIAGLFGGWVYRLRRDRADLELKVAERTKTILQDKETIEKQALDLKELDVAKTRFFANISHELRTPLTVIRGFATESALANTKQDGQELVKRMDLIKDNSDRLLLLVNQLLELGKLESGKLEPRYAKLDLYPELVQVLANFEQAANERRVDLQLSINVLQLEADVDLDKVLKVIYNLLSNALKFTPQGGTVLLAAEVSDEDWLEIHLIDDGIGIPQEQQQLIFERFSQVDNSATRRAEGSGIGLNFSRELALLMGGELTVSSKEGQGSDFCLKIPRWQDQQAKSMSQNAQDKEEMLIGLPAVNRDILTGDNRSDSKKPLLLLVEDNADIIAYLKLCLQDNFNLISAANGKQGVDLALAEVPDLIISDIMMPIMDGLEMCQRLKLEIQTSHIPVILLTALSSVENRVKGLRTGADAYLSKPFAKEELWAQIDNLLARQRTLQAFFSQMDRNLPALGHESQEFRELKKKEQEFLDMITEIIDVRLDDSTLRTEDLASAVALSQSQLWRKIKAITGLSTSEFVNNYRLMHACRLLNDGELTIAEVAYAIGFSDPSYFTKRFSKQFGRTPSQYLLTKKDTE